MSLSAEEKIRLLEKRIVRLEEMVARGAMAQYLFCPSLNAWLPAQCDDEGRQVIDPTDLDSRFLKLDGSGSMEGDFDCSLHEIHVYQWLKFHRYDLAILAADANRMAVSNRAGTALRDLIALNFTVAEAFRPYTKDIPYIFKSIDAGNNVLEVARVVVGADYCLQITSAGDIYPIGNKVKNLGSASNYFNNLFIEDILADLPATDPEVVGQLWNDTSGGPSFVRVSSG